MTEGGRATFEVTLSEAPTATVTVSYATADGTATAGSDYTAGSGTVTFDPGDRTEPIEVQTLPDDEVEGSEAFTVELSGADYRWSRAGVIGVAVSRANGAIDYDSRQTGPSSLDARLNIVTPYIYVAPLDNVGVWGIVGIGTGDMTIFDTESRVLRNGGVTASSRTAA